MDADTGSFGDPALFGKTSHPGAGYAGSPFGVCRNQRILIHKTFERIAVRGKSPMGWFF